MGQLPAIRDYPISRGYDFVRSESSLSSISWDTQEWVCWSPEHGCRCYNEIVFYLQAKQEVADDVVVRKKRRVSGNHNLTLETNYIPRYVG